MDRFSFSAPELPDWPAVKAALGWLLAAAWIWLVFIPYVRADWRGRRDDD